MGGNIEQLIQRLQAQKNQQPQLEGPPQQPLQQPFQSGPQEQRLLSRGTLRELPIEIQRAATQPAPVPGGDFGALGSYSQQALNLSRNQYPMIAPPSELQQVPNPSGGANPNLGNPHIQNPIHTPGSQPTLQQPKGAPFAPPPQVGGQTGAPSPLGLGKGSPFGGMSSHDIGGLLERLR